MGKKHPLRIMVTDDNRTNQMVAIALLGKLGYGAKIARNGVEALRLLETEEFDLILMDCHMPEMDGFEATRKIISLYGSKRPRIIALTASTMKEDVEACKAAGMDSIAEKPITINTLIAVLLTVYQQSERCSA